MHHDLKNQIAIITGAGRSTGIGYAIAEKAASLGAGVVLTDLPPDPKADDTPMETMESLASGLADKYQVPALAVEMDVTDTESIEQAKTAMLSELGRVDILFNNAGASFGVPSAIHDYDEALWLKTVDVNLHGVFRVSKSFVPELAKNQGRIVNVASRAGKVPPLFNGAYAAAKAGVIMLTKVMAAELAGQGIRVNAICPGQIMTDLQRWRFGLEAQFYGTTPQDREAEMCKTIPLARIGTPEEAADLAVYLASGQSSYLTGQAVNVCGGQLMEL